MPGPTSPKHQDSAFQPNGARRSWTGIRVCDTAFKELLEDRSTSARGKNALEISATHEMGTQRCITRAPVAPAPKQASNTPYAIPLSFTLLATEVTRANSEPEENMTMPISTNTVRIAEGCGCNECCDAGSGQSLCGGCLVANRSFPTRTNPEK